MINDITIVTITYNNPGIYNTIDSVLPLVSCGGKMIIQNGGSSVNVNHKNIKVYNETDHGIYDALNKGIKKVETKFFMLIHAGDTFIGKPKDIELIIFSLTSNKKTMSLNSQYIGRRLHSSANWKPWMLFFGAQPPHLPTIYLTSTYQNIPYSTNVPIIADFDYFYRIPWNSYINHNYKLIQMETGGATSSGLPSFIKVSRLFYNTYGLKGGMMALTRIVFKLIQWVY